VGASVGWDANAGVGAEAASRRHHQGASPSKKKFDRLAQLDESQDELRVVICKIHKALNDVKVFIPRSKWILIHF
jgi:hypothetical protein